MLYDIVIIGGGPAAVSAGVYAARKKAKTLLIAESFGGQSIVSADIHNWIGERSISGIALAEKLENHIRGYKDDVEIWGDRVESITRSTADAKLFSIITKVGKSAEARTVIICSGSSRKRLGIEGEDRLDGKGVAFCSICDAPLFGGKEVAVIGSGNAGLEAVIDLYPYAKKIYLVNRGSALKGDAVTQEKIKTFRSVEFIFNAAPVEILGDSFVSGMKYKDITTGEEKTLAVEGVFIEIGAVPNSGLVKGFVEMDDTSRIKVDPRTMRTSALGVWAAGDVTDGLYQQNNIAAGDAVRALLNAHVYLHSGK
ncbi:MAG: FAD-dependent oxidoreductase [Candidatus Pacebacteria bacterium]|nr:FAD-dependent oxidoreductase [Candidatus Paceibacterota bacterium]